MGKEGAMDVDDPQSANGHNSVLKENGLVLVPVLPQEAGEGLPYAPVNWPNPGDTWGWRVGKRTAISGYYCDRYLYLPSRLQKSRRGKDGFASKLSIKQYIQGRFPGADVESFFASFSWKIPSKQAFLVKDHTNSSCMLSEDITEPSLFDCQNSGPACKAGNRHCPSLTEEENVSPAGTTMFCDICCSEPNFCRECCCILCCKTIDLAFGGYSFIRCQAKVNDGVVCGHAAHIICALRSYLAGTVGGTIGLDAEYYCRRCDSRTELAEYGTNIIKLCESVESLEDNKKMLELVICLLRGSQKRDVKRLHNRAQLVLEKFECGNVLTDIGKLEDDISTVKIVEYKMNVEKLFQKKGSGGRALATDAAKGRLQKKKADTAASLTQGDSPLDDYQPGLLISKGRGEKQKPTDEREPEPRPPKKSAQQTPSPSVPPPKSSRSTAPAIRVTTSKGAGRDANPAAPESDSRTPTFYPPGPPTAVVSEMATHADPALETFLDGLTFDTLLKEQQRLAALNFQFSSGVRRRASSLSSADAKVQELKTLLNQASKKLEKKMSQRQAEEKAKNALVDANNTLGELNKKFEAVIRIAEDKAKVAEERTRVAEERVRVVEGKLKVVGHLISSRDAEVKTTREELTKTKAELQNARQLISEKLKGTRDSIISWYKTTENLSGHLAEMTLEIWKLGLAAGVRHLAKKVQPDNAESLYFEPDPRVDVGVDVIIFRGEDFIDGAFTEEVEVRFATLLNSFPAPPAP